MRQEDLCEGTTIKVLLDSDVKGTKPEGTKFKCPTCGRRMKIVSTKFDDGVRFFIPQHNPKGFKKQKKTKLKKSKK